MGNSGIALSRCRGSGYFRGRGSLPQGRVTNGSRFFITEGEGLASGAEKILHYKGEQVICAATAKQGLGGRSGTVTLKTARHGGLQHIIQHTGHIISNQWHTFYSYKIPIENLF